MKSLQKLAHLADRFELKMSLAQAPSFSAQSGEIEKVLRDANAFPSPEAISPLLNTAKVPESASVTIRALIDPTLSVKFSAVTMPNDISSGSLSKLLDSQFASNMAQALKKANIKVADTVTIPIATF